MYALKLGSSAGVPRLTLAGQTVVPETFGFSSGSPSVTSTGKAPGTGLVWVVYATGPTGAFGTLNAYDAVPARGVLRLVRSWPIGMVSKFTNVASDDGRVYVTNRLGQVFGFGTISAAHGAPLGATTLDFGSVRVGKTATGRVVITADRTVTVRNLHVLAPFALVKPVPKTPLTLKAGHRLVVRVSFHPTKAGGTWAYLFAGTSDLRFDPIPTELSGIGTTRPAFATSAPTVSFGTEPTALSRFRRCGSPTPGPCRKRSPRR